MTGVLQAMIKTTKSIVPNLVATEYYDSVLFPSVAVSVLTFINTGSLTHNIIGDALGEWLSELSSAQAALYELEVVITAGSAFNSSGSTAAGSGVWRDLANSWQYGNERSTVGIKSTTATFRIRRKSDLTIMATASITIVAEVISDA